MECAVAWLFFTLKARGAWKLGSKERFEKILLMDIFFAFV